LRAAGKIDFPISSTPQAQAQFDRGVALLHSFFYEEARRIFTAVAGQDPNCAMAQWGIAMTWWHPIWTPPTPDEMRAGQTAIAKAMSLKAGTDRERQFITALNAYYSAPDGPATEAVGQSCHGPVGSRDRVVAYEKEMRQLALAYPDDFEAQAFHALAVLALGYATPTDATLAHQLQAATILEKLWKKNPQHPGVIHYLIHSYDYPPLAQRGLAPAKAYGAIAPWVPHALHMPSHIFTRLGMWDESITANLAAVDAARAYAVARGRTATEAEELHALDYLTYSYLQEARDGEAKKIVDFVGTVHQTNPALEFSAAYALAAVPARYALERSAWAEAAALRVPKLPHWSTFPFMEALFDYAHALGRAHLGDLDGARAAVGRMAQLREASGAPKFDYFKRHLDLQMKAASAWILYGEGRKEEAVDLLRRAADAEDLLGKHPVSPGALVPMREQLGDLLLRLDRPKEAQQEFASALKIYPGRLQGLSGAARAAERSGDLQSASGYYAKLVAQTARADGSRPEVIQARAFRSAKDSATHSEKAANDRE
jgi:tetratricopeptide (TPR) repeat protein